ncbi:MAG: Fpg/Nei family DNA glycosylase [Phycisphaerales bacterium JB039]
MPELPDIECYLACLTPRIAGRTLGRVRLLSPFLLRSVAPAPEEITPRRVSELRRVGKRICIGLEGDLWLVIHLMIAGRLRWLEPGARPPARITLALLEFDSGVLAITEAGSQRRASLHIAAGEAQLAGHDPGGQEPLEAPAEAFAAALRRERHTLKRSLTDPRIFAGIGNAYADEILLAARLSPVAMSTSLTDEEIARLRDATVATLTYWRNELILRFAHRFPGAGDITAFRAEFGAHGKFGQPCPQCATAIQRIVHADNETNYCPRCQTGGRVLADRSLSRLLKGDWPRSVEELG